jgi:hypothetical protein
VTDCSQSEAHFHDNGTRQRLIMRNGGTSLKNFSRS